LTPRPKFQLLTGSGDGNLFLWDGVRSLHSKYLVQIEEAHDLAVLALQFAPRCEGEGVFLTENFSTNKNLATLGSMLFNFLRFLLIFGEKIGVFLKNQCYDHNFCSN
jgi:hypothetical protein